MSVSAQGVAQSVTQLSSVGSGVGLSFGVRGAVWRRDYGRSQPPSVYIAPTHVAHQGGGRGGGGRLSEDSYGPLSGLLSLSVRARVVLCLRETCRVQTCGRVSAHVRVCTRGGAVRHAAVFCRVWCGTFFWRAGRCVASQLRKVAASLCLHCANTRCTPGRRSGRKRTLE